MKIILVGLTEIEVTSFNAYTYSNGRGEKVLQFKVSAENTSFEELRNLLENNEQSIQYKEDDKLVCEYVGYGVFEAQYSNGVYDVEMHKTTITEQMNSLLNANERLLLANETLQQTTDALTEQNVMLTEQNTMLTLTLTDVLESVIPSSLEEITETLMLFDERITTLETVAEETVSE